jgi:hypothetical protein
MACESQTPFSKGAAGRVADRYEMTRQDEGPREGQAVWIDAVDRTSAGLKGAARSIARTLGAGAPVTSEYPPAVPFSDLTIFQSMSKHRELATMFL